MPDLKPPLGRRLLRSLNRLRARGPGELATLAEGRIREWADSSETLILLTRAAEPTGSSVTGALFRPATPEDAERYARDIGSDSASTFRSRLSDDVMCFVVEADGLLVHSSWVTTTAAYTREIKRYLSPPPGDAYIYESFTKADVRGRGIYPFALAGIVTWMSEAGMKRAWVGAEQNNTPSRRAIEKAGFEEAFALSYSRRFGRLTIQPPYGPMAEEAAAFLRD